MKPKQNISLAKRARQRNLVKIFENFTGIKHFSFWGILVVAFVLIVASWLPDSIKDMLFSEKDKVSGAIRFTVSVFIIAGFWFVLRHKIKEKNEFKIVKRVPAPSKLLLVFLSKPIVSVVEELNVLIASKSVDKEFFDKGFNQWKMPLLAIQHHQSMLEKVYVVTSNGKDGTHVLFPVFNKAMNSLFPGVEIEELPSNGVDFDDIESVYRLLDKLFDDFEKENSQYSENDLTVDITGGGKTNSVAAAMATFVEGRSFQYIGTNDYKVHIYDVEPVE